MNPETNNIMQEPKLVSVNITTYNRAHFLKRCIDAVLQQSYPHIEIIVVDDCSPDNTEEVMKAYEQQDKRIRYYRHDVNKGNASARNTALRHCRGFYVAFLDDDDEWVDPDKLRKQVTLFDNSKNERLGIICSGVKIIDQEGNEEVRVETKPKNLAVHLLKRNGIIHNSTVLTKRDIMLEVGGFDTKMLRGVDFEFFREVVVRHKYDVYFMPNITTAYYIHGSERMTTNRKVGIRKTLKLSLYIFFKHFWHYLAYPEGLTGHMRSTFRKIRRFYR